MTIGKIAKSIVFVGAVLSFGLISATAATALGTDEINIVDSEIVSNGEFVYDAGGDWRQDFGKCFFLIPDPQTTRREEPVGPDYFSARPEQYRYNNCYGGKLFRKNPSESKIDWSISTATGHAFAWHTDNTVEPYSGDLEIFEESSQWNPCLFDYRWATWDSDYGPTNDPLTVSFKLKTGGPMTVAYYFVDAAWVCRQEEFVLTVNGIDVADGVIRDFNRGKYLVFDINPPSDAENIIVLTIWASPQFSPDNTYPVDPACAPPADQPDVAVRYANLNTHISGVFINGTDVCPERKTFCFPVRSPGYWKNHPEAWPVNEIEIGGMTYSKENAIALMSRSVKRDKTYTLFRALVAAKLNSLSGADVGCLMLNDKSIITLADEWLAMHPVGSGVCASRDAWKMGEKLYLILDKYNNRALECGTCE